MEAAAVRVPDPYLGEDIVAYIVPKPGERFKERELLRFCERELGQFKTPTKVYLVNDLPKGPTGKVQRVKLSQMAEMALEAMDPPLQREYPTEEAASGFTLAGPALLEEAVTKVWVEVFGLDRVSPHDNFFELGGHSLLAEQLISQIRSAFQVHLPLRTLFENPTGFENPTVASLAVQIAQAQAKRTSGEEVVDILSDLESLSDAEAVRLLARRTGS